MAFGIYKPEEGYWTRMMSTIAVGVMASAGAAWLWNALSVVNVDHPEYIQGGGVLVLVSVLAYFTYLLYWKKQTTAEFFIATEGEMKKVNWSTRKEIVGSTWVVIIVAAAITIVLFTVDLFFSEIFKMTGVLYGESAIIDWFSGNSSP